jgi:tRNA modification GTPase
VVRISGPLSRTIHRTLTAAPHPPTPRHAHLHPLLHPQTRLPLDPAAITLFFPGPNSHTGEDVLELHLHGGPAIVRAVLAAIPLCAVERGGGAAVRYAEPGEFTRRALWNGRLRGGVMEVEALGEWVDAATEEQRKRVVGGHVRRRAERYEEWRRMLVAARGELEAAIDFAEDQGFEEAERGDC